MRLTSADELPPSDAVTLRSAGASPLPLDILSVSTGKKTGGGIKLSREKQSGMQKRITQILLAYLTCSWKKQTEQKEGLFSALIVRLGLERRRWKKAAGRWQWE